MSLLKEPLKTYGHEEKLINLLTRKTILTCQQDNDKIIYDNKLDVFYKIKYKYKNSKPSYACDLYNNESICLDIDHNLSNTFHRSYVDLNTGKCFTYFVNSISNSHIGGTEFDCRIQVINEKQELYEQKDLVFIKSINGTLKKRLSYYVESFNEIWNEKLDSYLKNGFETNLAVLMRNLSAWILVEYKLGGQYDYKMTVNQVLSCYSVLNNDCFHKNHREGQSYYYWTSPFDSGEHYTTTGHVVKPLIFSEQQDLISKIYKIVYRNHFKQLWLDCGVERSSISDYPSKLDYSLFKIKFLELWNKEN